MYHSSYISQRHLEHNMSKTDFMSFPQKPGLLLPVSPFSVNRTAKHLVLRLKTHHIQYVTKSRQFHFLSISLMYPLFSVSSASALYMPRQMQWPPHRSIYLHSASCNQDDTHITTQKSFSAFPLGYPRLGINTRCPRRAHNIEQVLAPRSLQFHLTRGYTDLSVPPACHAPSDT